MVPLPDSDPAPSASHQLHATSDTQAEGALKGPWTSEVGRFLGRGRATGRADFKINERWFANATSATRHRRR